MTALPNFSLANNEKAAFFGAQVIEKVIEKGLIQCSFYALWLAVGLC